MLLSTPPCRTIVVQTSSAIDLPCCHRKLSLCSRLLAKCVNDSAFYKNQNGMPHNYHKDFAIEIRAFFLRKPQRDDVLTPFDTLRTVIANKVSSARRKILQKSAQFPSRLTNFAARNIFIRLNEARPSNTNRLRMRTSVAAFSRGCKRRELDVVVFWRIAAAHPEISRAGIVLWKRRIFRRELSAVCTPCSGRRVYLATRERK